MSTNVVNPETVASVTAGHEVEDHVALEGFDAMVEVEAKEIMPDLSDLRIFKEEKEINDTKLVSKTAISIPFDSLYREGNVRTSACLALPQMVRSLRSRNFDPAYPISVSLKDDGRHKVLRGNRRTEGLEIIEKDFSDDFFAILPEGMIPALVYENLTEREEAILRNDHSKVNGEVGLDDWSQFLAIRQLIRLGVNTQAEIAAKAGEFKLGDNGELVPNRSKIQQRCNLARLPQFIIDEFEKKFRVTDLEFVAARGGMDAIATPVGVGKIAGLWAAHQEDRKAGHFNSVEGGPKLQAKWAEVLKVAPVDVEQETAVPTVVILKKWAESVTDDIISEVLTKAAGQETSRSFDDLDADMLRLRKAHQTLEDLKAHLGAKPYRKMVKEATPAS